MTSLRRRAFPLLFTLILGAAAPLAASDLGLEARPVLIIQGDQGGRIGERTLEVDHINRDHRAVEIRGRVCFSSCTVYLGIKDLCVGANTVFGFHGPWSEHGPIEPVWFEYWSEVMSRYYSPVLAAWFMQEARHVGPDEVMRVTGRNLGRLGYSICDG